jgi:ankyrin repeat protein
LSEIIKYILSVIGDKSVLNELTGLGATPLQIAAQEGVALLVQALLEAGCDPNLGVARTPLNSAKEFLETCKKKVKKAFASTEPGEKKRTLKLLGTAEETVLLLERYGGIDTGSHDFAMTYKAMQNGYNLSSLARPEVRIVSE